MYRTIAVSLLIITTLSRAEDFLKCSAVGKSNEKCVKDFYPDQEAQESNLLSAYENEQPHEEIPAGQPPPPFHPGHTAPSLQYSEQNQFIQGREYDYGYSVNDETTGDQKFHRESRHDNVVHGTYSLIEPDGSKRTVVYTADDVHGFNAVVYRDEVSSEHNYIGNSQSVPISSGEGQQYSNSLNENLSYDTISHHYGPGNEPLSNDFGNGNGQDYRYQNNAPNSLEPTNVQDSVYHPNSFPTIYDHNSNITPQNIPIVVDSQPQTNSYSPEQLNSELEILNHLGGVLGEQNFVNSLVKEIDQLPSPSKGSVDVSNERENSINVFPQVADATVNPIRMQLLTELVNKQNAMFLDSTRNSNEAKDVVDIIPNSGLVEVNSTVTPSTITTGNFEPRHNPEHTSIADVRPTPYPHLNFNTHTSTPSAESYDLKSSTVVERPHVSGLTTPVPITSNVFPVRLNNLNFGEFPLLAHISPSYSRRYARHYA
ncbi:uncharacterized protein LOC123307161 [Coccinella septempunctata]|uniref:uncharacterized protein LOC123307161 n=1 Tax=Coccinella septempunctata TaxID=41139 RepID=UPI001D071D4E|nr:uncharacterized protein LOC123307161 [Coccinella septempunctata]